MSTAAATSVMVEMTSQELAQKAAANAVAIIPVGSVEVLGSYGPLGADVFVGDEIGRRLAEATDAVAAPTMPVGDAADMLSWPGTLAIRPEVLIEVYADLGRSLALHGFRRIVFLSTHFGNLPSVTLACRKLLQEGILTGQVDWWKAAAEAAESLLETGMYATGHGGELISSVLLALRPETVRFDKVVAADQEPKHGLTVHGAYTARSGGPYYTYPAFHDFTDSGAWGDLTYANAEKGLVIIEKTVSRMAEFLTDFKTMDLPKAAAE